MPEADSPNDARHPETCPALLTGNVGSGPWVAFIGWFLDTAAWAQIWQRNNVVIT